ncbi:unnamed protein product, partial [Mesorhabditis spiculigera]
MDPPSQRGAVFLFPDPYKPGGMAVGSGCRPMESGSYQEFLKNPLNHPIYTHLPEPLRHLRAAREYEQPAMQKTPQMLPSNFYPGFFPTYPMQPQLQSPEQLQLFWAHVSHQFQHQFHPYVAQQQAVYQAALQPQPASVSDASIRCATIVIPKTLMLKETSSNTANIEDTDFSAKPSKQELRAALVKIQEASQRLLPPTTLSALFPAPSH